MQLDSDGDPNWYEYFPGMHGMQVSAVLAATVLE